MKSSYRIHSKLKRAERVERCDWPACRAACCIYGAWVDSLHAEDILKHAKQISPHMDPDHQSPDSWFDGQQESDDHALSGIVVHTTIVPNPYHYGGTSCIFLRKDYKCALQVAAESSDLHIWRFKPFYCVLHPLDLDEQGRITLDEIDLMLKEPASCLRRSLKPVPLQETFRQELEYLLGRQIQIKA